MGHRALVAYERTDGQYSLHHSQWGALGFALCTDLDAERPFGAGEPWERRAHEAILGGEAPEVPDSHGASVDPRPRGTVESLAELPALFDFLEYEAAFVVSTTGLVTAYRPLWFARTLDDDEPVGNGALVSLRRGTDPVADAARIGAWFRGVGETVRAMRERDLLATTDAREHLRERMLERGADGREVLLVD